MCQPVVLYQPIALPPDFDSIDMVALAKTVTRPCEHCGHSGRVIVRDGGVFCEHCGLNSQPRVAAKLKHRRRAAAKVKRMRRCAPAKRAPIVRVMPLPTFSPRPRHGRRRRRQGGRRHCGRSPPSDGDGGGGDPPPQQRACQAPSISGRAA